LEGLALSLKSSVMVDFRYEGTVANLPKSLVYLLVPHIVSIQEPKNIGSNKGRGNIDIDDGSSVYLAVIRGPVERQSPFYKWIRGVEVGVDITHRRFTAMLVSDMEGYVSGASVVLETMRDG
jgi:hypothetical protein